MADICGSARSFGEGVASWLRRRAVGLIDSTSRVGDATMGPPSPLPAHGGGCKERVRLSVVLIYRRPLIARRA